MRISSTSCRRILILNETSLKYAYRGAILLRLRNSSRAIGRHGNLRIIIEILSIMILNRYMDEYNGTALAGNDRELVFGNSNVERTHDRLV